MILLFLLTAGSVLLTAEATSIAYPPVIVKLCNKPKQYWESCHNSTYETCPINNCSSIWSRIDCTKPRPCKPQCRCPSDLYMNTDGDCITFEECINPKPKCNGTKQYYDPCDKSPFGPCPPQTCDRLFIKRDCVNNPIKCTPGCRCEDDWVMNGEGQCIPIEHCTKNKCTQPNEEYQSCGTACPVTCDNCKNPNRTCTKQCVRGCFCKKGYVRGPNGKCIEPKQCPTTCRDGEEYRECGSLCERRCPNLPILFCPAVCVPGCFCVKGKVRNSEGKCIDPEKCPKNCSNGEIYNSCGTACEATCDNPGPVICTDQCVAGCFCPKGQVRDSKGNCIDPKKCACTQPNEEYQSCGTACPDTCENYKKLNKICTKQCVQGCFCKKGYVRGPNGKCIEPKQCPTTCRDGEEYSECGPLCERRCPNLPIQFCPAICEPGCFCVEGKVRNSEGKCIDPDECPKNCSNGEIYNSCGTACEATCDDQGPVICTAQCVAGCFCPKGKVRDSKWNCIDPKQCEGCGGDPNAESGCGSNCGRRCDDYNFKVPKACPLACRLGGCDCRKGYVLNQDTGRCVLPKDCPNNKCKLPYEEYLTCGSACPDTCDNYNNKNRTCTKQCVRGCFCNKGYVRGPDGKCIEPKQCPKTCPDGQVYKECGPFCEPKCPNKTLPIPFCPALCVSGCICVDGKVRNNEGKCVHPNQCPCPAGEIYNSCGTACEATCDNPGPVICTEQCVAGCFCPKGKVRDSKGNCIDPKKCVGCGGDLNAVSGGCGNPCGHQCNDYNVTGKACPLYCRVGGCDCRKGYVLNQDTGRCVLPKDCPPSCPANETFSSCITVCPPQTCAGKPLWPVIRCAKPTCKPGCECKKGYLRNQEGNCILDAECPQSCPANETFTTCLPTCPPQTCAGKDLAPVILCAKPTCNPGCECKKGYFRNQKGNCILEAECPPNCPANEVYSNQYYPCPSRDCSMFGYQVKCARQNYTQGCVCIVNHSRDENGRCIPNEECPAPDCGAPHEQWAWCPPDPCYREGCEDKNDQPTVCNTLVAEPCHPRCICCKGYFRDYRGICVSYDECPSDSVPPG